MPRESKIQKCFNLEKIDICQDCPAPRGTLVFNSKNCQLYLSSGTKWVKIAVKQIKQHDYVVCGSGPGGATVAARLATKHCNDVAILEAGPNYSDEDPIKNSNRAGELEEEWYWRYFWQIQAAPNEDPESDPHLVGHGEFEAEGGNYTTGRLLGGGTSINGEQIVYPSNAVFEQWAAISGDDAWGPKNTRKVITKLENYAGQSYYPRGTKGPLDVRQTPGENDVDGHAIDLVAAIDESLGFKRFEDDDYNAPAVHGKTYGSMYRWQLSQQHTQVTTKDGVKYYPRESSYTAFLENNNNVHVYDKTTVLQVVWTCNRAIGFMTVSNGIPMLFLACKKTILAAGILTPTILQNSGVGDKHVLKEHGLQVIKDLPAVGKNSKNHLVWIQLYNTPCKNTSTDLSALYAGGAFLPGPELDDVHKNLKHGNGVREVQYIGSSIITGCVVDEQETAKLHKKIMDDLSKIKSHYGKLAYIQKHNLKHGGNHTGDGTPSNLFLMIEIDQEEVSRGFVTLQSSDPLQAPKAVMNYLTNEIDVERAKGILLQQVYPISLKLQDKGYTMLTEVAGQNLMTVMKDALDGSHSADALLDEYIFTTFAHAHHWEMSCRMTDVVNSDCEVFGVKDLIISDDTVNPFGVDGNTSAIAYIIGWIVADKIMANDH